MKEKSMRFLAAALILPLLAGTVHASTPGAWNAMYRQAEQRCIKASGLRAARASRPVLFSDATSQVALLVTGTYPQAHMRGRKGTSLCLYDRRRGTAEAMEADGWSAGR